MKPSIIDHSESAELFGKLAEIADVFGGLVSNMAIEGPLNDRQKALGVVALNAANAMKQLALKEQRAHLRAIRAKREN